MIEIRLPKPGPEFDNATITRWDCREGDRIQRGDTLAIIKTSFGSLRVTAEEEGTIEAILQKKGQSIDFEQPIAILGRAQPIPNNETNVEQGTAPAPSPQKPTPPQPALKPSPQVPETPPTHRNSSRPSQRIPEDIPPVVWEKAVVIPAEPTEKETASQPAIPEPATESMDSAPEPDATTTTEPQAEEPAEILEVMNDDEEVMTPGTSRQEKFIDAVESPNSEVLAPEVAQEEKEMEQQLPELIEQPDVGNEEAIAFDNITTPIVEAIETPPPPEVDAGLFQMEEPSEVVAHDPDSTEEPAASVTGTEEVVPDPIPLEPENGLTPIPPSAPEIESPSEAPSPAEVDEKPTPPSAPLIRVEVSPAALKLALRRGIDIDSVRGTGDHGKILYLDVERTILEIEEAARIKQLEEEEAAAVHPLTIPPIAAEESTESEQPEADLSTVFEHGGIEKSESNQPLSPEPDSIGIEETIQQVPDEALNGSIPEQKFTLQNTGLEPSFNTTPVEPPPETIHTLSERAVEPAIEIPSENDESIPDSQQEVESHDQTPEVVDVTEQDPIAEPVPVTEPEPESGLESEAEPTAESEPVPEEILIPTPDDPSDSPGDLDEQEELQTDPSGSRAFPTVIGTVAFHVLDEEATDTLPSEKPTENEDGTAVDDTSSALEKGDASSSIPASETPSESPHLHPTEAPSAKASPGQTPHHPQHPHPHYLSTELDFTMPAAWLQDYNERNHQSIALTDIMLKACGNALAIIPGMNATIQGDQIIRNEEIAIELSLPVDARTVTLTITDIDQKSLLELHSELLQYTGPEAIEPKTVITRANFVLSMLNMFGITRVFPSILHPQTCALGVGAVRKQVLPVDAFIGIRQVMELNLACNPLVMDGIQGARFIQQIQSDLELLKPGEYPGWLKGGQPFRIMENGTTETPKTLAHP